MEKRLPLALLLSFLVLVGWSWATRGCSPERPAPPPATSAPATGALPPQAIDSQVTIPSAGAVEAEATPEVSARVAAEAEQPIELLIGQPGQKGSYRARFTNRGAKLTELDLGNSVRSVGLDDAELANPENWTQLLTAPTSSGQPTGSLVWRASPSAEPYLRGPLESALWVGQVLPDGRGVEFELAPGTGVRFKKRIHFEPDSYRLRVELELINEAVDGPKSIGFRFTPAEVVPLESGDTFYPEPQAIAAGFGTAPYGDELPDYEYQTPELSGATRQEGFGVPFAPFSFAGVHNKYFAFLIRGADPASTYAVKDALWRSLHDDAWIAAHPERQGAGWRFLAADLLLDLELPARGVSRTWAFDVYAGPKVSKELEAELSAHAVVVDEDLGMFDGIATVLLAVMDFFHGLVGNWGVAIILLTLSVRALLFPLNRRAQTAMARYQSKMKRLQPEIDLLKKKHANDAGKLRQAQAELMQRERAFPPLGGCLPIFLQFPVFFGLFAALRTSFDLRQAPFALWMNDMAQPDHLFPLGWHLPLVGEISHFNLLPILMVVLWVLQQMLTPKPTDPDQLRMHKIMMFMPVLFGFFLYNYAAGLSLYMITQSGCAIVEMKIIRKLWPVDDKELPPSKTGFMARLAQLQQEQQRKLKGQQSSKRPGAKKR